MIKEKVLRFVKENNMIEHGDSIVLGVSGGADSMCLLCMLTDIAKEYDLTLTVVHVHHGIRGEEADGDMSCVEEFCKNTGVAFKGFKYDVPAVAKENGLSTEEAGRDIRYKCFYEVLEETGGTKIAVAHNANDSIETILLNMCRGTGISGMTGISGRRDNIIRPILCLTRQEIEDYLKEKNVSYRTDSTNLEEDYTRNKIRNKVLPYIKENINDKADIHIESLGRMIEDVNDYLETEGDRVLEQIADYRDFDSGRTIYLNASKLAELHKAIVPVVIRKAVKQVCGKLKDITMIHIQGIRDIALGETGKSINLPYDMTAVKYPDELVIRKKENNEEKESVNIDIKDIPGEYILSDGRKKFIFSKDCYKNVIFKENSCTKWLDCGILKNTFRVRTRQDGDYIVVNSQGGKKKLNDYFIDLKIPREKRDEILLLADGSHIVWVIGYRISEAYKVKDNSVDIVRVDYLDGREGHRYE